LTTTHMDSARSIERTGLDVALAVGVGVGLGVAVVETEGVGVGVGVSASAVWLAPASKKARNSEIIPDSRRLSLLVGFWRLGWNTAQA
jgi:hypothetical protein